MTRKDRGDEIKGPDKIGRILIDVGWLKTSAGRGHKKRDQTRLDASKSTPDIAKA